ncbi:MAG: hypothetical protein H6704_27305 [Myxococcales bacterium]|nr:hypothetical protein [Myxococcales bacterium]
MPRGATPDPVDAERRLLDDARRALGDGDARAALASVRRHADLHPKGALLAERLFLEATARHRLRDDAGARRAAEALSRRFPDSPLRARLPALGAAD